MRDYEVVKVEQEVPNEFLMVFDDGDVSSPTTNGLKDETRRAGAYYKVIERKMLLKKKRTEVRCRYHLWRTKSHSYLCAFSRSSASETNGHSCGLHMSHQVRRKRRSVPTRSQRCAIRCTYCIQPMRKAKTTPTPMAMAMAMRMQMGRAR